MKVALSMVQYNKVRGREGLEIAQGTLRTVWLPCPKLVLGVVPHDTYPIPIP